MKDLRKGVKNGQIEHWNLYDVGDVIIKCYKDSLHKKWSFPMKISSVNVTKSAVSCSNFSTIKHNAKCDATHGKELKILTPKQMLHRSRNIIQ